MTTQQAAEALGVHRSRVLHFIREGKFAAIKHGRDWWIDPAEVARFKALERPQGWKKGKPRKPSV